MSSTKRSLSVTRSEVKGLADQPRDLNAEKDPQHMTVFSGDQASDRSERACLDSALQSQIGHKLKIMFDQVAKAPIPDKFMELLEKLNSGEKLK